ncbi:MAG TPA: dipeptidase [Erysipelotrichaceae bacterium]|nr:dipeptidase [Erysipelotrichaceae bacterium]
MRIIDLHCDTITRIFHSGQILYDNDCHLSIKKMLQADYLMQCFALFVNLKETETPYQRCLEYIEHFQKEMESNKEYIRQIYCYEDLLKNRENNIMSAMLTIEEGAVIEGDLEKLRHFYSLGVRMMTLTWNYENEIGHPNQMLDQDNWQEVKDKGLTSFGREVIKEMNRLGMIVDVSHGSDKLFFDVIEITDKPIVASHSNSRTVNHCPRNLTDEMIVKLKENGGVAGINYCPAFISKETDINQIPMIVEHIKHIARVGGVETVALGSDFDGIKTPKGLSDCSKMDLLTQALRKEGFSEEDIDKIYFRNFLRVLAANCK